jgi:tRNA threonylcarbamoyladenosine dehydratase
MDWVLDRLRTPNARLVIVAIASSTITALAIFSLQSLHREYALSSLKKEAQAIPPSEEHRLNAIGAEDLGHPIRHKSTPVRKADYDEELVLEQLARNRSFFGDKGLSKIRGSFVIIVGAGGVGSWAATMLARSGVGMYLFKY